MMKFLSAKDVEKFVELDPKKNHNDWDVFVAVAKAQKTIFAVEKSHELVIATAEDDLNECNEKVKEYDSHEHPLGILTALKKNLGNMIALKKDMTIRSKVRGEGRFGTKKAPIYKYDCSPPDLELEKKTKIKREKVRNELVHLEEGARSKRVHRSPMRFEEEAEESVRSKRVPKRPLRFEENAEQEQMLAPIKKRCYNQVVFEDSSEDSEKLDAKRPKKMSKRKKKEKIKLPDPSPGLSDDYKRKISSLGGTDIQLVITKALTTSDCKKDQQRLLMPKSNVVSDFLNENEKVKIEGGNDIPVKLIQPNFEETDIKFKKWDMWKESGRVSNLYVLKKPWSDVVKWNRFEAGNIIQVWSFRVDEKLRLAIVRLPECEEQE